MALTSWNNTTNTDEWTHIQAFNGDKGDVFLTIGGVTNVMRADQAEKIVEVLQKTLSARLKCQTCGTDKDVNEYEHEGNEWVFCPSCEADSIEAGMAQAESAMGK